MTVSLNQILFQSDVVSKPVRDNFTDIENALNVQRDDFNAAVGALTSSSEVVTARDYHGALADRIRSGGKATGNLLVYGGVIDQQLTPDMTVQISAGEAIVNGVGCKWNTMNSGVITPPVSGIRLDYIVINSNNVPSIVLGTAAADPEFPTVASSQLVVGCLVVKSGTTSLNDRVEIFNLRSSQNPERHDHYIGSAQTLRQGKYQFNNLIIDATLSIDFTNTSGLNLLERVMSFFNLEGIFYLTALGTINTVSPHLIFQQSNGAGPAGFAVDDSNTYQVISGAAGNNGSDGIHTTSLGAEGGGGATGAGSLFAAGGNGGNGGSVGTIGKSTTDGIAGVSPQKVMTAIFIKCWAMEILGSILNDGAPGGDGNNGSDITSSAGGGGASGGSGGYLFVFAKYSIKIYAGGILNCNGGDAGNGGSANTGSLFNAGGGGGGGGAGGAIVLRSLLYANLGTVSVDGGALGSGGIASGGTFQSGSPGLPGTSGLFDQQLHSDLVSDLKNTFFPFNVFEF